MKHSSYRHLNKNFNRILSAVAQSRLAQVLNSILLILILTLQVGPVFAQASDSKTAKISIVKLPVVTVTSKHQSIWHEDDTNSSIRTSLCFNSDGYAIPFELAMHRSVNPGSDTVLLGRLSLTPQSFKAKTADGSSSSDTNASMVYTLDGVSGCVQDVIFKPKVSSDSTLANSDKGLVLVVRIE